MNLVAAALLVGVFAAVIVRQVTGRGPGVWAIFLAGAFVTVAVGVLTFAGAETALAAAGPTLLFLFGLFLFAGALQESGALDHVARWLVGRAPRSSDLPAVLFVGFGVASAFLLNDALVLIGVPVLLAVAARTRAPAVPLLLTLCFAVTVGSVLTPFGNPQNLLVATQSGIPDPVVTFVRYLLVPTAFNLMLGAWYLHRAFGPTMPADAPAFDRIRAEAPALFPATGWATRIRNHPVLVLFPGTMVVVFTLDITAAVTSGPIVPVWETVGAGAILLLLLSPTRTRIVSGINWELLLLFAGLFVVVAGAVAGGVIPAVERLLPIPGPGRPVPDLLGIAGTSLAGPQIVSNVPWVALQIPVLQGLGYGPTPSVPWLALAGGSTLAGNVTLLGAASNLIVADLAERSGISVRLGTFVRYGLPLAALTIGVLLACLWLGL